MKHLSGFCKQPSFVWPLVVLFLVSACASPSRQECEQMNWFEEGYKSGQQVQSLDPEIRRYRQACTQEHGVKVGETLFRQGHGKGLKNYCQSINYLDMGRNGDAFDYPPVCDPQFKQKATERHRRGLTFYCTYDVGYNQGLGGQSYQNVCDSQTETGFLKGYNLGVQKRTLSKIESLSSQVKNLQSELHNKDWQIQQLNSKIEELETELEDKDRKIRSLR